MSDRSDAFFREATKNLQIAKEELFKPAEDIVSFSVCKNSQFAIENFLKGFLCKNGKELEQNETINTLYQKCALIDPNFKEIDFKAIGCKEHAIDSRYCTEINSVSACLDTADEIDTFLRKNSVF